MLCMYHIKSPAVRVFLCEATTLGSDAAEAGHAGDAAAGLRGRARDGRKDAADGGLRLVGRPQLPRPAKSTIAFHVYFRQR